MCIIVFDCKTRFKNGRIQRLKFNAEVIWGILHWRTNSYRMHILNLQNHKIKKTMQQTIIFISLYTCHFLADYTHLSSNWMLSAKRLGKPLFPIFAHAGMHTILMFITLVYFHLDLKLILELSAFQLTTHFLIDLLKGRMNGWFPSLQSPANKWHWIVFGFDQYMHTIVIILMSYYATKN